LMIEKRKTEVEVRSQKTDREEGNCRLLMVDSEAEDREPKVMDSLHSVFCFRSSVFLFEKNRQYRT
jgi:hypothetical protein